MAQLEWNELITNSNLYWPYSSSYIKGDWSFYPQWGTQGLGVLRYLNMPGVLSEGSFHDYYPESWRLQNLDYRKCEARNLADAIVNYFGEPGFTTGFITGVARDPYVNTDYYWIAGSNDEKIPVNEYTATLLPLNKVYQADTMNNGVFFFDSIAPGNYQVVFQADGYFNDTANITVTAGQTTIVDRWLPFDTTVAPLVLSHFMPSLPDSVSATEPITFHFSTPMDTLSVNAAFSISPNVNGQLSWEDDNKKLIFSHTETFDKATEYTVTLSTSAKSIWQVPLTEAYSFNFISKNRNRLALLDIYPKNNDIVNPKLQFRLIFDAPLKSSSLIGNVVLYNSNNAVLPTSSAVIFDENGKGFYFFLPQQELNYNESYKLVLSPEIVDEEGTPYYETTEINFTTQQENPMTFSVFDDLEDAGNWQDPGDSQYTQGTDPLPYTYFALSPIYKISGNFSGSIYYRFSGNSGGICAETNSVPYNIGANSDNEFGMWVFGDLSYNLLEYWFYDENNNNETVFIDTINWAGWDLKYINKNDIPGSGNKQLHSVVIKQNPEGAYKGAVYIDDIFHVPGVNIENINSDKDFYFIGNYPNPFKDFTEFSYNLTSEADINLEIFNVLGQKIASVKKQSQKPGKRTLKWDVSGNKKIVGGTYFYRITAIPISDGTKIYKKSGICVKY